MVRLKPGDFALYSSVDRYTLEIPDSFRQLVVQIARDDLLARLPNADTLTGIGVSGGSVLGGIIRDTAVRLVVAKDQTSNAVQQALQDTVIESLRQWPGGRAGEAEGVQGFCAKPSGLPDDDTRLGMWPEAD